MADKQYFELQPSELAIFRADVQIFSVYVAAGDVNDNNEKAYMEKAMSRSIYIARHIENAIQSDDETGH